MIIAEELSYSYPDGTRALEGLSFSIRRGESAGIVGANGTGKSTLVSHLNAYLLAERGRLLIEGIEVNKKNRERVQRVVGVLFQNPDDQLFTARLYDDVLFGPKNLGMDPFEAAATAETILRRFGLWELRDKPPSHISQGQKRFAALASVLVMRPSILVMDEPTSDLDPGNRRKLIELVNSLQATKLTVSHDLDFIWESCSRVFIMSAGRIVAEGATRELLSNRELLESFGLELPLRLQGSC